MALIEIHDTLQVVIVKLCSGNPGALMALGSLAEVTASIDPDSAFGDFSALVALDDFGIYGKHIWHLYQDICHGNVAHVIGVLRAVQLGKLSKETLMDAVQREDRSGATIINAKEMYDLVRLELANFDPNRVGEREA